MSSLNPITVQRTCEFCGTVFNFPLKLVKQGRGRFCTRACHGKSRTAAPVHERINKLIGGRLPNGCIPWIGKRDSLGYGRIQTGRSRNGTQVYGMAHRIVYELRNGLIPDGLILMHSCDNPWCVNPEHLTIGTDADNHADMVAKGRAGFSVLTPDEIREIRKRHADGETQRKIAKDFGRCVETIRSIVLRRSWRRV